MKKTPWKKVLSSALTCFVIALAVFLVFRGNYQEILENLSKAPLWGTAVLFALAAAYQAAEAGICMALVRARLPGLPQPAALPNQHYRGVQYNRGLMEHILHRHHPDPMPYRQAALMQPVALHGDRPHRAGSYVSEYP